MSEYLILFLYVLVFVGPLLFALIVGSSALGAGSYLLRATKSEMVFLRPASVVASVTTLLLYIVGGCTARFYPAFASSSFWQSVVSHPRSLGLLIGVVLLVVALYWAAIIFYRKISVLVLDLDRQTYRGIDGTGFIPKVRTGSWREIAGITVWKRSAPKSSDIYLVRLKWMGRFQVYCDLGGFEQRNKAEAFAEQMARETGLPLVASSI